MSFRFAATKRLGSWLLAWTVLPVAAAAADDVVGPTGTPGTDWELTRTDEESGIGFSLYHRDVPGSSYDRYRLEAVFDVPLDRVIEALRVKRTDDRYLGKGVQRMILEWEPEHSLTYLRLDLPVVADRDVTLRSRRGFDAERGVFRDEWWTANEAAPPVEKGVVRINHSEGFWEFDSVGDSRTHVVHESFADPGGHAPGWLINLVVDDKLINEIVTLRRIVDRELPKISAPPPDEG